MQDSNPNTPNSGITSILGDQWRCMSMAQKKIYKDMAQLKKAEFNKTYPHGKKRTVKESDKYTFSFKLPKKQIQMKQVKKDVFTQQHQTYPKEQRYNYNNVPPVPYSVESIIDSLGDFYELDSMNSWSYNNPISHVTSSGNIYTSFNL